MERKTKQALLDVLNYLGHDEQRHYEECELNGEPTENHIYRSLLVLRDSLQRSHGKDGTKEIENTCMTCGAHLGWFIGPADKPAEDVIATIREECGDLCPSRCENCAELARAN